MGTELRNTKRGGPAGNRGEDSRKFPDFVSGGRQALLEARDQGADVNDLMDEALECVDHLACMVDHWRPCLGRAAV